MSSPCASTGVRKQSASGPAIATRACVDPPHPRHDLAVVEADHELGAHRHLAVEALDDPHDVRRAATRRHEVDRAHRSLVGLVDRLQDQRVVAVPARRPVNAGRRREQPAAVIGVAEQRREARTRVEAREAAPVDRPVAADERRRLQVADERVVLDPRHAPNRRKVSMPPGLVTLSGLVQDVSTRTSGASATLGGMGTSLFDEPAFIARVESANTDEFSDLLRQPTKLQERALRAYFGDGRYQRLHSKALRSFARRGQEPDGNVVVLHGMMGSELSLDSRTTGAVEIWPRITRIMAGALSQLQLSEDGRSGVNAAIDVRATGIMKRHYGELLLALSERWRVRAFWYDWRKDIRLAAAELEAYISSWVADDQPVHLVAHSMGGLVARSFIKSYPSRWDGMWDVAGHGSRGGRLHHARDSESRLLRHTPDDHGCRRPRAQVHAA